MVRKILAVVLGVLAGMIFISLVQMLGHYLYPEPKGLDTNDMNQLEEYVKNAPFMALFFVILSYAAGAVISGFTSTVVAKDQKSKYAIICGILFLIQSIFMMASLPTDLWFWVLGILVWLLVFVGYKLGVKVLKNKQ